MSGPSEGSPPMESRDFFRLNSLEASQPQLEHQMHMSYTSSDGGTAFRQVGYSPPTPLRSIPAGVSIITDTSADQRRKRGRPRKDEPDGGMNVPLDSPPQQEQRMNGSSSLTPRKPRGRPLGSKNKSKLHSGTSGSSGYGFTPHILDVKAGEDVSSKIMVMCQSGPKALCVLSASGTISNVTLRQPAICGGTATYAGHFDILSLSGSFMLTEIGGQKTRTGGLTIALAGGDGNILGGSVAGLLVAASPARVILGSFLPDIQRVISTDDGQPLSGGGAGASSSQSRGTVSETSGGAVSPLTLSSSVYHIRDGMSG